MTKPNKPTPQQLATWGSIGGRSAQGKAKTRPAAHYRLISLLGVEARRKKRNQLT